MRQDALAESLVGAMVQLRPGSVALGDRADSHRALSGLIGPVTRVRAAQDVALLLVEHEGQSLWLSLESVAYVVREESAPPPQPGRRARPSALAERAEAL